jgi:dihydroorotate dehydrogenase (fumarate)
MSGELSVNYLGLELSSPVIVGACPLSIEPETVRQLINAGAGAIVLPSVMQEQLIHRLMKPTDPLGAIERSGYQPQQDKYNGGADNYLRSIELLKRSCTVPVIASLNGASLGDWLDYAKEIEAAGADALECNVQTVNFDPESTSNEIESGLCEIVASVVSRVSIPVAVKLSQRYTNLASMARQLKETGAKGLVLFTHQPHWDVCTDRKHWTICWELSPVDSLGGVLEGIVRIHGGKLGLSIAASGGVATSQDAIKAMIAGADVVMVTSAIYREGPGAIRNMVNGIQRYLGIHHHPTLQDFQASRPTADIDSERTMRLEYVDPLTRSKAYFDPAPTTSQTTGDAFGHIRG